MMQPDNPNFAGTVIFDGDCGICTASAEWIERHDTSYRMRVVPYQLADLDAISPGLTPDDCRRSAYFVEPDGRRHAEARAAFEILRRLSGVWGMIGWLCANPLCAWFGRPFYRLVADNRTWLSARLGLTHCAVPSPSPHSGESNPASPTP